MKIGILTFHRAYNCGAMLQAYALKMVLERWGHEVEFPQCNNVGEVPRWMKYSFVTVSLYRKARHFMCVSLTNLLSLGIEDARRRKFKKFRETYLPERECSPAELEKHYDCLIVGSDQVWNPDCTGEHDAPFFLLENFNFSKPIIAYAASCGDNKLSDETCARIRSAAAKCASVSVREQLVNEFLKANNPIVPDPTLLLKRDDYAEITSVSKPRNRKLLYCFTLGASPFVVSTARELAKRLDADCVIQPTYQFSRYHAPKGLTYGVSPKDMLTQMFDADYVVTASFHGTVFAVLSGKPFVSLRNQKDALESRPASLLRQLEMSERLVNPENTFDEMEALLRKAVPADMDTRLEDFGKVGWDFLERALSAR